MELFKSEDKRRVVNTNFDTFPTFLHTFNFEVSKKFIKHKIVLDVGCWTGQLELLAYKSAKKMVAIDSNPEAISFAKKKFSDVIFKVAKADRLPFPKSSFDTVLLLDVLEHVPSGTEEEVLREIRRVLRPGGFLIITTPNKNFLSILLDPAYFLLGHRHYSIKEVSKLLYETGFKIEKIRLVGNLYTLVHTNFSLFFKHTLGFEPKFLRRKEGFLLKEHAKKGFGFLYVVSKAGL